MKPSVYVLRVERRAAAMIACSEHTRALLQIRKRARCTCPRYDGSQIALDAFWLFQRYRTAD